MKTRLRVLIATGDLTFVPTLVSAYERRGYDVTLGTGAFFDPSATFDVVHLHWPEELVGWSPPDNARTDEVLHHVARHREHALVIGECHNLAPHGAPDDPAFSDLYDRFYGSVDIVGHASAFSKRMLQDRYPRARGVTHVVHHPWRFLDQDAPLPDRRAARHRLRLGEKAFGVCLAGVIRSWDEIELSVEAFRRAAIPAKRWISAFRMKEFGPFSRTRRLLAVLNTYRRYGVLPKTRRVSNTALQTCLAASDAFIIPRRPPNLNSGLCYLGVECGAVIAAPRYGAFEEHFAGTGNVLYTPGDTQALAEGMRSLADKDRAQIAEENRAFSREWGWDGILTAYDIPHH